MDDSTNEAWSWGVDLDTFEGRPTLSTGVYDCLSCIKEFGSSQNFQLRGEWNRKTFALATLKMDRRILD